MCAWVAPRTWVAGETVTAALMNTHVRDNLLETFVATTTGVGDMAYSTAANSLARLAIGSAGQALRVNSSTTAPEWANFMGAISAKYHCEGGSVTTTTGGGIGISFNTAFLGTPITVASLATDTIGNVSVMTESSSGVTIIVRDDSNNPIARYVHWIAIGVDA